MSFNIISNDESGNHFDWLRKYATQADTLILVSPFLSPSIGDMVKEIPSIKRIVLYSNLDGFDMARETIHAIYNLYVFCQDKISLSVYCNNKLHGKVYLLYNKCEPKGFFVTSGNFTENGLKKNQEYGVFIDDAMMQNNLLDRICEEEYDKITFDEVIQMENEAKIFEAKHKMTKTPVFKAEKFKKKSSKTGTRYFLKMLGSVKNPYEKERNLKRDNPIGISEKSYNEFKDRLPRRNDIFICHGAGRGNACIVGYCRLITDIPIKEKRYEGDKWNYKYYIEDLKPQYSIDWYNYRQIMNTNKICKEFIDYKLPNQTITPSGDSLGDIKCGRGLIELTEDFAMFIISKVETLSK